MPTSAPIHRGGCKSTRNIVGPKHCWVATPACGSTLPTPSRIGDDRNKRIIPAPSALPASLERAPWRGRLAISLPLTLLARKERQTSAVIVGCARAPRQPRQSSDRAQAPVGKTRRHDRSLHRPDCFRPGETHTRLSKKDRKLPCQACGPRREYGIHLAKGSLATTPRFFWRSRSPPQRCQSASYRRSPP